MTEINVTPVPNSKPVVSIIAAIMNLLMSAFCFFWVLVAMISLMFGRAMNIYEMASRRMSQVGPDALSSMGVSVFFVLMLSFSLIAALFFLYVGFGLLKGNGVAWYLQVAVSIFCLVFMPVGTIINIILLIFLFRPSVRSFYKV